MIRDATRADIVAIHAIYSHYVTTSTCTFQTVIGPIEEQIEWFDAHGPSHPIVVDEHEGALRAWASLSVWNRREGYARTVEESVYVHPDHHRKGLGALSSAS